MRKGTAELESQGTTIFPDLTHINNRIRNEFLISNLNAFGVIKTEQISTADTLYEASPVSLGWNNVAP